MRPHKENCKKVPGAWDITCLGCGDEVGARLHKSLREQLEAAEARALAAADDLRAALSRAAEAERMTLEWLESFWAQFACEVPGRPGVRHDGGLSVLADAQEALSTAGRLITAGAEGMDWWIFAPRPVEKP